jgi:hypothetical protein
LASFADAMLGNPALAKLIGSNHATAISQPNKPIVSVPVVQPVQTISQSPRIVMRPNL